MTYGETIILEDTQIELSEFSATSREWHAIIHTTGTRKPFAHQVSDLRHGLSGLLSLCLSCLQYCPKEAITLTEKSVKREHYHNPNVSAAELMESIIHID